MGLAAIEPNAAISNLGGWAEKIGVKDVPNWLSAQSADTWGFVIGFSIVATCAALILYLSWAAKKTDNVRPAAAPKPDDEFMPLPEACRIAYEETQEEFTGVWARSSRLIDDDGIYGFYAHLLTRQGYLPLFGIRPFSTKQVQVPKDNGDDFSNDATSLIDRFSDKMTFSDLKVRRSDFRRALAWLLVEVSYRVENGWAKLVVRNSSNKPLENATVLLANYSVTDDRFELRPPCTTSKLARVYRPRHQGRHPMTDERVEAAARDWPEDFAHENGHYANRCTDCGNEFEGHKRRRTCKVCATAADTTPVEGEGLVERCNHRYPENGCACCEKLADIERRLRGPHEWGYRCLAGGGFIEDNAPFEAAAEIEQMALLSETGQAGACVPWETLEPLLRSALHGALRKWCEPEDVSPLERGYIVEDTITALQADLHRSGPA